MNTIIKYLFIPITAFILSACGGTLSNRQNDNHDNAIKVIASYAQDDTLPPPSVQDYKNADISGVTTANLKTINAAIAKLEYDDVDTIEEIYTLMEEQLNISTSVNNTLVGSSTNENYQKNISLPRCDASNPKVQMIQNTNDWSHINDLDKTIFCVSPGDYSSLKDIKITASGTKSKPRYIVLDNGNEQHPVQLNRSELAKYRLTFISADYWVVDRQAYWEDTTAINTFVQLQGSSYNIFNRGLLQDTANGFTFYSGSDGNTIQNHHMEKTQWSVDKHNFEDVAAINLVCQNPGESIKNTVVVNNEIINYVDAFQTVRLYGANQVGATINFDGTVVYGNDMYVTNIMYSNGDGVSNKNGAKSFTENAIDLKGGATNAYNPILISHNRMWGYKSVDNTYSNLADAGNAMVVHYDVRNVRIENNLIFNSDYGFTAGGPLGKKYPLENAILQNNIFYNIKENSISLYGTGKEGVYDAVKNVKIIDNLFAKNTTKVLKLWNTDTVVLENNVFSDTGSMWFGENPSLGNRYKSLDLTVSNNYFYNTPQKNIASYAKQDGNINSTQSVLYNKYDGSYTMGKFRANPKVLDIF